MPYRIGVAVILRFRGAQDTSREFRTRHFRLPSKGHGWQQVNVRVRTPTTARRAGCRIELILYGHGQGTARYDDVRLMPLEQ